MRKLPWILLTLALLNGSCTKKEVPKEEPPPPPYELLTAMRNDGPPIIVKADKKTGEAWYRESTDDSYQWTLIKDESPAPPSEYQFSIVAGEKSWNLVRLDVHSGRGWGTESGAWKEYASQTKSEGRP